MSREVFLLAKIDLTDNIRQADRADSASMQSLEALLRSHGPAVFGVALANARNVHDAEDIMQDVFVKAFTKVNTLRDRGKARAWLMRIARRMCIDHYRRKPQTRQISEDIPAQPQKDQKPIQRLHEAISKLPKEYRETISLYYLDGRKCESVAQSLSISEVAVRRRLVRARLMLHDLLVENENE